MTRLPLSSLVLRLLMVAGPLVALGCGGPAGHPPSLAAYVVVALLSVLYAARPDAWFGTVVLLGVVLWWAQALDGDLPVSVLPAVLALTVAHVAGLVADHGPPRMALAPDVGRLWAGRGALAVLVAAALWVLATLVDDVAVPGLWVVAVALGTLAAAGVAVVLGRSREV